MSSHYGWKELYASSREDRGSRPNPENIGGNHRKKQSIPLFVFGMAVGAIVLLIVGFSADWVITAGAAQKEAERVAQEAILEQLVSICVAQFEQEPNKIEALQKLKAESTWARGDYVEEQGWATMPGSQSANTDIADECAEKILALG